MIPWIRIKMFFGFRVKIILAFIVLIIVAVLINIHDNKDKKPNLPTQELILSTTESETTETLSKQETTAQEERFDTYIILADDKTTINGEGATFENGKVNINRQGVYAIKGSLANGSINISDDIYVKLIFMGASVHCENASAIKISNVTERTCIYLEEGTVNSFSGGSAKEAVLSSDGGIDIDGKGSLIVRASNGVGVFSDDEVTITNGTVNVISADNGIIGSTGLNMGSATVSVTSSADGIKTTSIYGPYSGEISIIDSNVEIVSDLDGIQSESSVNIKGGKLEIETSGSRTTEQFRTGNNKGFSGEKDRGAPSPALLGSSDHSEELEETPSAKGIKAQENIVINGAGIKIAAKDDAVHANVVEIESGYISIESTDDGIHGDEKVKINGGDIDITGSYEGIESKTVSLGGGTVLIKAINDGINASSDEDEENCLVEIDGAYVHIDAEGDGVESDGDAVMLDGTLIVFGPTNSANSAIDCDNGLYMVSGTVLTLSDKSNTQKIESDGIPVLTYTFEKKVSSTGAIVNDDGESIIGYHSSKEYDHIVFSSDKLEKNSNYSVYLGGSFDVDSLNGIYMGEYNKGTFAGRMK